MRFEETEEKNTREKIDYRNTLKLVYRLSIPHRKDFLIAFSYLVASTGVTLLTPLLARYTIDLAIKNKDFRLLLLLMIAYLANSVIFLVLNYLSTMKLIKTGQALIVKLKNDLFRHMMELDLHFYAENPVGKLNARVQSDTSTLYELFTETVVSIFKDIIMFVAIFVIMAFYSWDLTRILLPVVLAIMILIKLFIDKSSSTFVNVRKLVSEISGFLAERLNFIATIQSFNREKYTDGKLYELNLNKLNTWMKAETYAIFFFLTILLFDPMSKALVFGYGGVKVLDKELSIGIMVMFILYLSQLFEPIFRFSEHISIIQRSFSAGHRINNILNRKLVMISAENSVFLDSFKDSIEFSGVSMRYREDTEWILKNVSFRLEKGKTLAIVGKTGGGKTTVTNLLFRFYDYQKGHIFMDGADLKKLNIKSVRKLIGLVQQDIYLFPGTIMQNLKLMDENVDDERVHFAIKTLELDYFYKKHPLNKVITEKGANLSIGEKQIIALTRTMVLDQDILALDEATSNIDPYTERMITRAIKNIMKHKTMIIIAHRLSTIESADTIMFLNNGEVAEQGSHRQLMALKGHYYKFYRLQAEL